MMPTTSRINVNDLFNKNTTSKIPSATNGLLFSGRYDDDPRPPLMSAFNCTMMMNMDMKKMMISDNHQSKWASVVFHQPITGKAIYCARLMMQSMNMATKT